MSKFRDWEHILRVAGLFLAGIGIFVILKFTLQPEGFGTYGHYRTGAIQDNAQFQGKYAGQGACAECHSDVVENRATGKHATISCEACHGPLATHANEATKETARIPDGREFCLNCHTTNVARPENIRQIRPAEHAPEGSCLDCHAPHNPLGE